MRQCGAAAGGVGGAVYDAAEAESQRLFFFFFCTQRLCCGLTRVLSEGRPGLSLYPVEVWAD
jgi:hypothetical protein